MSRGLGDVYKRQVIGTSKKLKPNAIIKGIILNNINKIIEGAIKTYALRDGLFQYFLIFSIYYFNLSIERATFY